MKRLFIPVVLIISLVYVTYLLYTLLEHKSYVLYSSASCCSIFVEEVDMTDDDIIVYHVKYSTNTGSTEDIYVEEPELESSINVYQEYCYQHHN